MRSGADAVPQARGQVLLIAPHGSYRTSPFMVAAAKLGVGLLVASEGRHSLVSEYAEGIHVDFAEREAAFEALLGAVRRVRVGGVIGTDDATTELAAGLAGRLGLPHNPPAAVRIARRKDLARTRLAEAGLPVPGHRRIDLRRPLAAQIEGVRFPCVVKPLALSASRGVIRADDRGSLLAACARVARILQEVRDDEERNHVLVEDFVAGFEVAVEAMLADGALTLLAVFDKPDSLDGPFFEETYYVTPSRLAPEVQHAIRDRIADACRAYGLREGPVHAECRIDGDRVWVLEVAARTIGGLCGRLLRFGTGYSLEELVLAHALGEPILADPQRGAAGVLMIPVPQAGILRRVEGIGAARRVPFVEDIAIQVREGYELVPWPEGSSYLGFVFARAPTPEQAESALRDAHACINIVVGPLWKADVRDRASPRPAAALAG
jgi:biotin carboxylase